MGIVFVILVAFCIGISVGFGWCCDIYGKPSSSESKHIKVRVWMVGCITPREHDLTGHIIKQDDYIILQPTNVYENAYWFKRDLVERIEIK